MRKKINEFPVLPSFHVRSLPGICSPPKILLLIELIHFAEIIEYQLEQGLDPQPPTGQINALITGSQALPRTTKYVIWKT